MRHADTISQVYPGKGETKILVREFNVILLFGVRNKALLLSFRNVV